MPNTLVHIGIQGPVNRLLFNGALPQWMMLGCIIPDIPWIAQRFLALLPGVNRLDLRIYSINQSSLFFCLILSAALALGTKRFLPVFGMLGINSLFHLLLDATQIKWANGVQLFVPFSWQLLRFDWFWPEHIFAYAGSLAGLIFLAFTWKKTVALDLQLSRPKPFRGAIMLFLLLFYGGGPLLFFQQALEANNHFCRTLTNKPERPGQTIEFDRGSFSSKDKMFLPFTQERFMLEGQLPKTDSLLSLQGRFLSPNTIEVTAFHQHSRFRDRAATLGILLVAAIWIFSLRQTIRQFQTPHQGDSV